jgi:hypothetical protein
MARGMLRHDQEAFVITREEAIKLHILFGRDGTAADAYLTAMEDERSEVARELL